MPLLWPNILEVQFLQSIFLPAKNQWSYPMAYQLAHLRNPKSGTLRTPFAFEGDLEEDEKNVIKREES